MNRWSKSGFEVTVLSGRSGLSTALLFQFQSRLLVVDAGDGTSRDLFDLGLDPSNLAAIALTHDHPDHATGLTGLLWWCRLGWRRAPVRIFRPGAAPLAAGLAGLFRQVFGPGDRFDIVEEAWREGARHDLSPFAVVPFPVKHLVSASHPERGLMEAYGFEVFAGDRRVVVSGDTGPCPTLAEKVRGADLALIEATFPGDDPAPRDTHLNWSQASRLGALAQDWLPYHTG